MTNLEGDTGPYIQYTYARIRSILQKAKYEVASYKLPELGSFNTDELAIMRYIYRFPEVVETAAREFAPHLVCSYLYELASRYNKLYNQHRVVDSGDNEREVRLLLSAKTARILANGLGILGIAAPSEM